MRNFWPIDRIRSRVFLVPLPGMSVRGERFLIQSCRKMTRSAIAAGVPVTEAWSQIAHFVERTIPRMRSEQERETLVAIMQRLRAELLRESHCYSR